jgi:agmatine deiminase
LRRLLGEAGRSAAIELYDYLTDDIWIRDFGPLFLVDDERQKLCIADWRFNAWGNKYPEHARDDRASAWIAEELGLRRFTFDTVLEGGAIESNGAGQLLTTEAVLLNPNRNGKTTTERIEQKLCSGLGVNAILWLEEGLVGDDTDGHIDNLARFFKSDGILIAETIDPANPNVEPLRENAARLQGFRTTGGQPFAAVQLPLPSIKKQDGQFLAASYLNYLLLNGAVLVPTYGQAEADREAMEILADCFPEREIVGFDCSDIIHEGGALHCMSQNQPKVSAPS